MCLIFFGNKSADCRWAQEFKYHFKIFSFYPKYVGRNTQESHLHTALKDCEKSSHDGKVPSTIIMMIQGDAGLIWKELQVFWIWLCLCKGVPMLMAWWRCQWTKKMLPILFRSKPIFQWNQLSRPHGPLNNIAWPFHQSAIASEASSMKTISVCFFSSVLSGSAGSCCKNHFGMTCDLWL